MIKLEFFMFEINDLSRNSIYRIVILGIIGGCTFLDLGSV